jgi:hypothetical protein
MQRNEEGYANAENNEWNEEVTVGEDGPRLVKKSHRCPMGLRDGNRRKHKDAARALSRRG